MRTSKYLFILALFVTFSARTQEKLIICSTEKNTDQSVSIYADCQIYGEYTVKLTFTSLSGYKLSGNTLITVTRGRREIARLVPEKNAAFYSVSYSYQYSPGVALHGRPPDTSFVYLLPATPDNVLRISHVSSISERLGLKSDNEYYGTGFLYQQGDTICAARAGTVYTCYDGVVEGEKGTQVYKSVRNRIAIEQKDGTLANYAVRAPVKLLITPGDNVYPGQPLAVFNAPAERYEVLFSVSYLDEKKISTDNRGITPVPSNYINQPTIFHIGDDVPADHLTVANRTFKVIHPKSIVGLELSKKEKKKLNLL